MFSRLRKWDEKGGILALLILVGCSHGAVGGTAGNQSIYDAWRSHRSRIEVTAVGSVARLLGTREGPSGLHQGFLLHLRGADGHGLTLKVEDNVDITGTIPLRAGDDIEVHGEYIYDARGGIIHYTHHDPRGTHIPGYIRLGGRVYSCTHRDVRLRISFADSISKGTPLTIVLVNAAPRRRELLPIPTPRQADQRGAA